MEIACITKCGGAILQALSQNRNDCFVMSLWLETYMQGFMGWLQMLIRLQLAGIGIDQIDSQRCGSEL
jgi:hypothetical protein